MPSSPPPPEFRAESHDPGEQAVARGQVLDSRLVRTGGAANWQRDLLVKSPVQDRLLHVQESLRYDAGQGRWVRLGVNLFLADQVIVRAAPGITEDALRRGLESVGMQVSSLIAEGVYTVGLGQNDLDALPNALGMLARMEDMVSVAEPDGVGFGAAVPNDPSFGSQWGLYNTGQSSGTPGVDVAATQLWDIMEGAPGVVIAVLDSGLNFTHPDLQNVAWTNAGEIAGNGIDDDANGRVDDVNGWDFVNGDNSPADDHGHGSHVTGIIAANRNNSAGIAGLVGGVKILVCKILNASNSGLTSNLIAATTYARRHGVPLMNMSLQNYPFNNLLNTEFNDCQTAGILLCISAGNQGVDNDTTPNYPSCYPQTNIIAVGNHHRADARWSGSNYGATTVDLFAPGRDIYSTVLGSSYSWFTGTSQAAPHVTAVAAALKHLNPAWTAAEIKTSLLTSAIQRPDYSGLCTTGGRLNAVTAVSHAVRQLPLADTDGDGSSNLLEYAAGTRMDSSGASPSITLTPAAGYLKASLSHSARVDAIFEVQRSTDLTNWTASEVADFSSPTVAAGGIPLDGSLGWFLRLRVIASP